MGDRGGAAVLRRRSDHIGQLRLSLLTNDEVIAVDQAGVPAKPVSQSTDQQVWYAHNPDGSVTVALFNLGDGPAAVTANWNDIGDAKVGFIGGSGYVTINNVVAPVAGTYLMRVAYVDGDSSRTAIVSVDGTPFELPLSGTNDNDWDTAQTVTVPVYLNAGNNSVEFGNPNGYVSDIDKITV